MQAGSNNLTVVRRTLDLEDYIDVARRHRSWIVAPVLASLVLSVVVAFLWPDTYVSTAVIRVVPPQVPERYVPTNVNTELSQRINSMAQAILSRGPLTSIIETYGLYPRERSRLPMEDVLEKMRKVIRIGSVRTIQMTRSNQISAFQVAFSYQNRHLAQKVTADVVSRFITENTRERANQSAMTTQFLKDQWQAAKSDLEAVEQRLTEFRLQNAGRLPDQWLANLTQLSALEARVSSLNGSVGRAKQEKLLVESELRIQLERLEQLKNTADPVVAGAPNERLARMERDIQQLERVLTSLQEHYKPNHPDVQRVQAQLASARREREELLKKQESTPEEKPQVTLISPARAGEMRNLAVSIQRLQAQARAKDLEIEGYLRDIEATNRRIQASQTRFEGLPVSEQQYIQLQRERDLAQKRFDDLNLKMTQSELATDLENRKQGETLELLESASLPEKPTDPKRSIIIAIGALVGLALGAGLALAREMKDASLKNLKDVRAYTQLVVLGSVPLLENDLVVQRRRRLAWLAWATASVISAVAISGSIFYYYATKL